MIFVELTTKHCSNSKHRKREGNVMATTVPQSDMKGYELNFLGWCKRVTVAFVGIISANAGIKRKTRKPSAMSATANFAAIRSGIDFITPGNR